MPYRICFSHQCFSREELRRKSPLISTGEIPSAAERFEYLPALIRGVVPLACFSQKESGRVKITQAQSSPKLFMHRLHPFVYDLFQTSLLQSLTCKKWQNSIREPTQICYLPHNHLCFTFFGTIINITDKNILLFGEGDDKQHTGYRALNIQVRPKTFGIFFFSYYKMRRKKKNKTAKRII